MPLPHHVSKIAATSIEGEFSDTNIFVDFSPECLVIVAIAIFNSFRSEE